MWTLVGKLKDKHIIGHEVIQTPKDFEENCDILTCINGSNGKRFSQTFNHSLLETPVKVVPKNIQKVLTPKTRQRKNYYSEKLANYITELNFPVDDQFDIITNALKKIDLFDKIIIPPKMPSTGRKRIPIERRKIVWDLWHKQSSESTDTTKLAKLRKSCWKKMIQDYVSRNLLRLCCKEEKSFISVCGR